MTTILAPSFAVIDPDLFNFLSVVSTPFNFPLFKFSSLSPTNRPILFVACSPTVIVPLPGAAPVEAPVTPKGPNSTVFVPITSPSPSVAFPP